MTSALLQQIVRGLDGVTAGPWEVADEGTYHPDEGGKVLGPQQFNSFGKPVRYYVAQFVLGPDAAHIARCSPDAIREIAAYVRDLEDRLAKAAEALERLVRNGQKQGWNDGYSEDMDFARAALSQIRSEK